MPRATDGVVEVLPALAARLVGAAAGEPDRRGPERVRDVCVLVQADPAPLSLLEEGLGHAGVLRRA